MTVKCVDAQNEALSNKACAQNYMPPLPSLLLHCLQNLVQYFKLAYVFSVLLHSFVIVLT